MATGQGLICKLGQHIPIEGADNIVQVNMFGETIITQKTNKEGTIGILFDIETCLSHEYASKNNMYRHSNLNEDKTVTGYLEDDRRIRPIKLKGVKVSGLFMPLSSISYFTSKSLYQFYENEIGVEINKIGAVQICEKYISKATKKAMSTNNKSAAKASLAPTFKEHIDTEQWAKNMHKVKEGDLVIITEKLHGTSGRCGYLPTIVDNTPLIDKFITKLKIFGNLTKTKLEYNFVVGSRRVVKSVGGREHGNKQNFYEDDIWTKVSKEHFENKLRKGETVYFEIVGYTPSGELIMPSVSNKKLEKFMNKKEYKEFIERYGETTTFTYGCNRPVMDSFWVDGGKQYGDLTGACKVFVYRITMTNEDGDSIDLSWDQVKRRCEQLNVEHVPELDKFLIKKENLPQVIPTAVELYTNQNSKEFLQHIREGVCVRVENGRTTPEIYKSKSFIFKVLEGIIKDSDVIDIEESN